MAKVLQKSLERVEFAVVDIETTGYSHHSDKIVEVAAVKLKNGKVLDSFSSLIYTDYIPYYVTKNVHGIDVYMLKDAPKLHVVKKQFCEFVEGCVLVGHNIKSFDSRFLCKHFGISSKSRYVDTLGLSRKTFPGERYHSLEVVTKRLKIRNKANHRALIDAQVTAKVFLKLLSLGKAKYINLRDIL